MPVEKAAVQRVDFAEAMRQAEAEAGVPADSQVYSEFGVEYPEPDEQGRIAVTRTEEDPQAEEVAVEEPVAEDQPEIVEEPAPDPMAETNKKLGQIINENAELRRQLEALQAQPEPQPQPAPFPTGDTSWFEEFADTNPQEAATWAIQNQQPYLADKAIRSWHEIDPVAAGRFERQLEMAAMQQALTQQLAPQIQAAQEVGARSQLEQALSAVASRHDDFAEVMGTMTPEVAASILSDPLEKRILEEALTKGSQQEKESVFERLYRYQKAESVAPLVAAAREAPQRISEEARQEKLAATVGSAQTTTPETPPETEEQRMQRAFKDLKPSMREAWVGRK